MKTGRGKWWFIAAAIVLIGLAILVAVARSWLESAGGQKLLQRELSSRLGMAVTIDAGYQLGLFPTISMEGTGLVIAGRTAGAQFVASKLFEADIAVIPLLRQEVKITSIELAEGFLEFDQLPESEKSDGAKGKGLVLPEISALIVRDFAFRVSGDGATVEVERLALSDFKESAGVPLELEASIVGASGPLAKIGLEGQLTVDAEPLSARLDIEQLGVDVGGFALDEMTGAWRWIAEPATLNGSLAWTLEQRGASIELEMELEEEPAGRIRSEYTDPQVQGKIATEFSLQAAEKHLQLNATRMELAGQVVQGNGCLAWDEVTALRLMLTSEELDVDRLLALLPEGGGDAATMPMEIDASLTVVRARLKGAEALDVSVLIGKEPTCP